VGPELDLRRERLVRTRVARNNTLQWNLHDLWPELALPGGALFSKKWTTKIARRLARAEQTMRVRIARDELRRMRELTHAIKALEAEIAVLVTDIAPQLVAEPGCGPLTAAKLVGEIAGIERFRTDAQLAMHAGVAPLDVSSGRQQRHRLSRAGNRQLNRALHTIAIVQKRVYAPAKAYIARRQGDGKSNKEALRALKRQLARRVFNILHLIAGRAKNPQRIQISTPPQVPCLT
jgi:transposase